MRAYVYGDESGNFDFSDQEGASRYFILTTVVVADHAIEADLVDLRRQLAWEGESLASGFHATNDKQRVRDRVFAVLGQHDFRVDATILEKRKTNPRIRTTEARFYGFAWYAHLAGLVPGLAAVSDELLIIAASIGTSAMRSALQLEIRLAKRNAAQPSMIRADMWSAASNPMLQAADYCAWALHRKWERADVRAYALIADKIASEFEAFQGSTIAYY